jgi:TPR repeat protein
LLTTGDITSARLFLERASNAGLADAAMALAETYDPATVARLSAVGLVGDREQAKAWYRRAQVLGSSAAAERLKNIGGQ